MHSQCIIFYPSLSSSQFQLSAKSAKNTLSFCNLPKQVYIHSHVTCQVSMKANPQPTECVCVEGWGGDIWMKLWLTHRLPCSRQLPKAHGHSEMTNEMNTGQMWEVSWGYGFSPAQAKMFRPEWIFSKYTFHHISDINFMNKDWSLQSIPIRKEAYLVSQLPIFYIESILVINTSYQRI